MHDGYSGYQDFYSNGPYAQYLVEHQLVGSTTARLLHVAQPAGACPDPPGKQRRRPCYLRDLFPKLAAFSCLKGCRACPNIIAGGERTYCEPRSIAPPGLFLCVAGMATRH